MTITIGNGDLELGDVNMIQDTFQSLLDSIENEVNDTNRMMPRIAKAPHTLRELNPTSFSPRVVSIGPLHREADNVQAFEKQKIFCLNNLLRRTGPSFEETLKICVQKAYSLLDQIKECYVWEKTYDDAVVAKMMVVDACFILEFIYCYSNSDESYSGDRLLPKTLIFDLVLLENQIPLFFLNEIYQCTILKNAPKLSLIQFIHPILNYLSLFEEDIKIDNISINTAHILSLLHECYKPQNSIESDYLSSAIHSAVDLDRAGVKFKPNRNPKWPMGMDVKSYRFPCFSWCLGNTTLRMPVLYVHDFTELVLRNLIAYEHSCQTRRNHITSYASAMDVLINTQEDVAKLVESEVLINNMGSNEEAANMINNICKEVITVDFFYCEQWDTLKKYCNGYWPKNITWLRSTYFGNPWNIIALFAGIILFALTVLQTIFTIKSVKSS